VAPLLWGRQMDGQARGERCRCGGQVLAWPREVAVQAWLAGNVGRVANCDRGGRRRPGVSVGAQAPLERVQ
jgi:hypothetical protein